MDLLAPRECAACAVDLVSPGHFCALCEPALPQALWLEASTPLGVPVACAGRLEGPLAQAVRRFKYDDRPELAAALGDLARPALSALIQQIGAPVERVTLVPVPLHPRRLAQRGYNQAALLVRRLVLPGVHTRPLALARCRDTPHQVGLDRVARQDNVAGSIQLRGPLPRAPVILVDDVLTTGATVAACLRALGAARVTTAGVVTVARAGSVLQLPG